MSPVRGLHKVRIESGDSWIFTRVFLDDQELRGVRRVAFDSGDPNGPKWKALGDSRSLGEPVRVFVEFYVSELSLEGSAQVDQQEVRPR